MITGLGMSQECGIDRIDWIEVFKKLNEMQVNLDKNYMVHVYGGTNKAYILSCIVV